MHFYLLATQSNLLLLLIRIICRQDINMPLTSANTIMKTDICNCIYMVSQTQNKMDFQPNMTKWVLQHVRPIMAEERHGFSHPSMMGTSLSLHMMEVFAVHAWNCLSLFPVTSFMLEKRMPFSFCLLYSGEQLLYHSKEKIPGFSSHSLSQLLVRYLLLGSLHKVLSYCKGFKVLFYHLAAKWWELWQSPLH